MDSLYQTCLETLKHVPYNKIDFNSLPQDVAIDCVLTHQTLILDLVHKFKLWDKLTKLQIHKALGHFIGANKFNDFKFLIERAKTKFISIDDYKVPFKLVCKMGNMEMFIFMKNNIKYIEELYYVGFFEALDGLQLKILEYFLYNGFHPRNCFEEMIFAFPTKNQEWANLERYVINHIENWDPILIAACERNNYPVAEQAISNGAQILDEALRIAKRNLNKDIQSLLIKHMEIAEYATDSSAESDSSPRDSESDESSTKRSRASQHTDTP